MIHNDDCTQIFRMKRLLHVCDWLGPPYDGGNIYQYEIIKRLSCSYECGLIVVRDHGDKRLMTVEALRSYGIGVRGLSVLTLPKRRMMAYFKGWLVSRYPPGTYVRNKLLGDVLRATVEQRCMDWAPDVIVIWGPRWAPTLQHVASQVPRRILYACDSVSMVCESLARHDWNLLRRAYNRSTASRYRRIERDVYPRYDEIVFVSERDAVHSPCAAQKTVICNGVDTDTFTYKPELRSPHRTIGFHGNLSYLANVDAVFRLTERIAPVLYREVSGLQIRIIGGPADAVRRLRRRCSDPTVSFTGYVENLADELNKLWVYVGPLTMGGGVKNKVLEALASGCPVVGTKEAFSGLTLVGGEVVQCRDDSIIGAEISRLLQDEHGRRQLSRRAREWAVATAGWDAACAKVAALVDR